MKCVARAKRPGARTAPSATRKTMRVKCAFGGVRRSVTHCANAPSADGAVRAPSLAPLFRQKREIFAPPCHQPITAADARHIETRTEAW